MNFNEIKRLLEVSSNVLAKNLQLEQEGLVTKRAVYENTSGRIEYKLYTFSKRMRCHFHKLING
jgi:DNA-binding HxlR family transcriptional regulator